MCHTQTCAHTVKATQPPISTHTHTHKLNESQMRGLWNKHTQSDGTHTHTHTRTTDVIPFHHLISAVSSKSGCLPGLLRSWTEERRTDRGTGLTEGSEGWMEGGRTRRQTGSEVKRGGTSHKFLTREQTFPPDCEFTRTRRRFEDIWHEPRPKKYEAGGLLEKQKTRERERGSNGGMEGGRDRK